MVQERVGAFFRNTYVPGTEGICVVCRGSAGDDRLCGYCRIHQHQFRGQLADRTILLTYAQGYHPDGKHQSAHEVRAYKTIPPVDRCRQNLRLMIKAAVALHQSCITEWLGTDWEAITFVPSAERPARTHPLAELAGDVRQVTSNLRAFHLIPGTGIDSRRVLVPDRFAVPDDQRSMVNGRNVLVIDDTWTSGASAQGAAIAVKRAGAHTVTVLCIARWLSWKWSADRPVLQSLDNPYDPLACPVDGLVCRSAASFDWGRG
ncbi:hypothetical protein KO481_18305 [Nocardia sp. NEAU-G5]|uniref:Amidophosphoribosyltransferase n=1 Tax=Nocardia albiluteola TaxID=2842303 RepID=A0ABS6B1Z0_9NOCA|nr:hypothetical protein [Nocardia albiluteola]MBU3063476.1 hypothetical protein [Nocardia albiluteola]